jgi:protease-4
MTPSRSLAAVAAILCLHSGASDAAPLRASPFRGALVPAGAVAGDADGTSVETNPGQLGLLDGASLALVIDRWGDHTRRVGRGEALLLGTPLFGGLALGAGVQSLRPTLLGEPSQYWMLQLGAAQRLSRALSLGFMWEHLFGNRYGGRGSWTLGLGLRPHPVVAAGLSVRDVGRPHLAGEPRLAREWEAELALRPLGTDRLEAAIAGRIEQGVSRRVRPRARLSLRVARGLTLFGELDTVRDQRVFNLGDEVVDERVQWSALFGATVALGPLGLTGAGIVSGARDGDPEPGPGASFVLRTFPGRRPPLVAPRHVERVTLSGLENDGTFLEMVVRLRRLAADPTVGALQLDVQDLALGMARIEELRGLVQGIRQRKPVFAQITQPSMREYYLAAACDRITIHPAGAVSLGGLSQTVTFYKSALDKLGVKVELVRIAEYKGAMEPFVMTEQSAPVRQNRMAVLDENYSRIMGGIAEGRVGHGLSVESLPQLVDRAVFSASEAAKEGLVDAVADERDSEGFVRATLQRGWSVRNGAGGRFEPRLWNPSRVGVVLVDGAIVDGGDGGPFSTGGLAFADRIISAIDQLREDGSVKSVVLRVNSPGGSALASDRIARAVIRLRARKPVIVSMGDLAASGGYYVAAPGDEIFASPGTVTGSIGIFSLKVDLEGLLAKVGLSGDTYQRGAHADLYSPFRAWTDEERKIVEAQIRSMYQLFLDTVAAGRKSRGITAARADELGRGRIWTGAQALDVRLVDKLGGFSDALDEAARRGGVELGSGGLPEVVVLPKPLSSPLETLMRLQGMEAAVAPPSLLDRSLRTAARLLAPLLLAPRNGLEARLPYDLSWE